MSGQYSKSILRRLEAAEEAAAEKSRVPVIIARLQPDGRWLFNGKTYAQEELDELQRKNNCPMVLDDVCASVKREAGESSEGRRQARAENPPFPECGV